MKMVEQAWLGEDDHIITHDLWLYFNELIEYKEAKKEQYEKGKVKG